MTPTNTVVLLAVSSCLATVVYGQMSSGSQFAMMDWLMDDPHKANRMPFWTSLMQRNTQRSSAPPTSAPTSQPMTSGHYMPDYSFGASSDPMSMTNGHYIPGYSSESSSMSQYMTNGHYIPGYSSGNSASTSHSMTSPNFMGGFNFFPSGDDVAIGAHGGLNFDF